MKAENFWWYLHRVVHHPVWQISIGAIVASSGALELWYEEQSEHEIFAQPEHGIILLGVIGILISIEHLLYGVHLAGLSVVGETDRPLEAHHKLKGFIRRTLKHPWFEVILGTLLFVAGLGEISQDLAVYSEPGQHDDVLWPVGLILLGAMEFTKGIAGSLKAILLIEEAEQKLGWHIRFIDTIEKILRRPAVELYVSVCIVILGIWEEIQYESMAAGNIWLDAHLGMVISGANGITRLLPSMNIGMQLADDAESKNQES